MFAPLFSLEKFTDENVTSFHRLQGSEDGMAEICIRLLKNKAKELFRVHVNQLR